MPMDSHWVILMMETLMRHQKKARSCYNNRLRLQALAEKLMENKTGGVVAMDPNTGEILSL